MCPESDALVSLVMVALAQPQTLDWTAVWSDVFVLFCVRSIDRNPCDAVKQMQSEYGFIMWLIYRRFLAFSRMGVASLKVKQFIFMRSLLYIYS